MKIAFLASTALVLTSLAATPAMASHNATTVAAMEGQCTAIAASRGLAFSASVIQASIAGTPAGATSDVGDPYEVSGQTGVGTPALSDLLATGTAGHKNGGSQNIFTTGTATATSATYTFNGTMGTVTPYTFAFECALSELVNVETTVPGPLVLENIGQCVSRIQSNLSTQNEAQAFCKIDANREMVAGPDVTTITPTPTDRGNEAGVPVPQDVDGTRSIIGELNTAYASLAAPLIVNGVPQDNVLACNSPDNNQTWVIKHSYGGDCAADAARLGLTPISGKRK